MKERIEKIMEVEQLSASKFADAIGVQRSSISHIISGRNKPSLELVNKILQQYQHINADWLLLGKGEMIASDIDQNRAKQNGYKFQSDSQNNKRIPVKIVVLYSDNTFEEFKPQD